MVYVLLGTGFEEIEALATVDILRRAGLNVLTVGVGTDSPTGAHAMTIQADIQETSLPMEEIEAVVLPGGMPGTVNLENNVTVLNAVGYALEHQLPVAAICAAPSILGHMGCLRGVRATCYPGFEDELIGAAVQRGGVVTDKGITTAAGAGVAVDFALELVSRLVSPEKAYEIRSAIQCR